MTPEPAAPEASFDPGLVLTDDLSSYLRAAEQASPTGPVPCFDPRGEHEWPVRVAEALGVATRGLDAEDEGRRVPTQRTGRSDYLVLAFGSDEEFRAVAWCFAQTKDATMRSVRSDEEVLNLAAAVPPEGFLVVVGHERDLSYALAASMARDFGDRYFGMMCAATAATASALVAKAVLYQRYPQQSDDCVATLVKGEHVVESAGVAIHPAEGVDVDRLMRPELRRVVSFVAHASEDFLRLDSHHVLCGRTEDSARLAGARAHGRQLPACMHDGSCVFPDSKLHEPSRVRAQVVLANACLTVKLGTSQFGPDNSFSVGQRFLEGWAGAIVASPLLKDGTPAENLLFHRMLDDGHHLGSATRAVNQNLRRWGMDAPDVYLFGDPETTLVHGERGSSVPLEVDEADDGVRVRLSSVVPEAGVAVVRDPGIVALARRGDLEVKPTKSFGARTPFYSAAVVTGDEVHLYVLGVSARPLPDDDAQREVVVSAPRTLGRLRQALHGIERHELMPYLDLRIDKGRSILRDLRQGLPKLAEREKRARTELSTWGPFLRGLEATEERIRHLDELLLEKLLHATESREYHFVEGYRHTHVVLDAVGGRARCRYCGEPEYWYCSENIMAPGSRRYLRSCPVCGATEDVDDESLSVWVEGSNVLRPGEPTPLRALVRNRGAVPLNMQVGARVTNGRQHGFRFEVTPGVVTVEPGSTSEVDVVVTPGVLQHRHLMLLRVFGVAQGRVAFAGRDLHVEPRAAPLPSS